MQPTHASANVQTSCRAAAATPPRVGTASSSPSAPHKPSSHHIVNSRTQPHRHVPTGISASRGGAKGSASARRQRTSVQETHTRAHPASAPATSLSPVTAADLTWATQVASSASSGVRPPSTQTAVGAAPHEADSRESRSRATSGNIFGHDGPLSATVTEPVHGAHVSCEPGAPKSTCVCVRACQTNAAPAAVAPLCPAHAITVSRIRMHADAEQMGGGAPARVACHTPSSNSVKSAAEAHTAAAVAQRLARCRRRVRRIGGPLSAQPPPPPPPSSLQRVKRQGVWSTIERQRLVSQAYWLLRHATVAREFRIAVQFLTDVMATFSLELGPSSSSLSTETSLEWLARCLRTSLSTCASSLFETGAPLAVTPPLPACTPEVVVRLAGAPTPHAREATPHLDPVSLSREQLSAAPTRLQRGQASAPQREQQPPSQPDHLGCGEEDERRQRRWARWLRDLLACLVTILCGQEHATGHQRPSLSSLSRTAELARYLLFASDLRRVDDAIEANADENEWAAANRYGALKALAGQRPTTAPVHPSVVTPSPTGTRRALDRNDHRHHGSSDAAIETERDLISEPAECVLLSTAVCEGRRVTVTLMCLCAMLRVAQGSSPTVVAELAAPYAAPLRRLLLQKVHTLIELEAMSVLGLHHGEREADITLASDVLFFSWLLSTSPSATQRTTAALLLRPEAARARLLYTILTTVDWLRSAVDCALSTLREPPSPQTLTVAAAVAPLKSILEECLKNSDALASLRRLTQRRTPPHPPWSASLSPPHHDVRERSRNADPHGAHTQLRLEQLQCAAGYALCTAVTRLHACLFHATYLVKVWENCDDAHATLCSPAPRERTHWSDDALFVLLSHLEFALKDGVDVLACFTTVPIAPTDSSPSRTAREQDDSVEAGEDATARGATSAGTITANSTHVSPPTVISPRADARLSESHVLERPPMEATPSVAQERESAPTEGATYASPERVRHTRLGHDERASSWPFSTSAQPRHHDPATPSTSALQPLTSSTRLRDSEDDDTNASNEVGREADADQGVAGNAYDQGQAPSPRLSTTAHAAYAAAETPAELLQWLISPSAHELSLPLVELDAADARADYAAPSITPSPVESLQRVMVSMSHGVLLTRSPWAPPYLEGVATRYAPAPAPSLLRTPPSSSNPTTAIVSSPESPPFVHIYDRAAEHVWVDSPWETHAESPPPPPPLALENAGEANVSGGGDGALLTRTLDPCVTGTSTSTSLAKAQSLHGTAQQHEDSPHWQHPLRQASVIVGTLASLVDDLLLPSLSASTNIATTVSRIPVERDKMPHAPWSALRWLLIPRARSPFWVTSLWHAQQQINASSDGDEMNVTDSRGLRAARQRLVQIRARRPRTAAERIASQGFWRRAASPSEPSFSSPVHATAASRPETTRFFEDSQVSDLALLVSSIESAWLHLLWRLTRHDPALTFARCFSAKTSTTLITSETPTPQRSTEPHQSETTCLSAAQRCQVLWRTAVELTKTDRTTLTAAHDGVGGSPAGDTRCDCVLRDNMDASGPVTSTAQQVLETLQVLVAIQAEQQEEEERAESIQVTAQVTLTSSSPQEARSPVPEATFALSDAQLAVLCDYVTEGDNATEAIRRRWVLRALLHPTTTYYPQDQAFRCPLWSWPPLPLRRVLADLLLTMACFEENELAALADPELYRPRRDAQASPPQVLAPQEARRRWSSCDEESGREPESQGPRRVGGDADDTHMTHLRAEAHEEAARVTLQVDALRALCPPARCLRVHVSPNRTASSAQAGPAAGHDEAVSVASPSAGIRRPPRLLLSHTHGGDAQLFPPRSANQPDLDFLASELGILDFVNTLLCSTRTVVTASEAPTATTGGGGGARTNPRSVKTHPVFALCSQVTRLLTLLYALDQGDQEDTTEADAGAVAHTLSEGKSNQDGVLCRHAGTQSNSNADNCTGTDSAHTVVAPFTSPIRRPEDASTAADHLVTAPTDAVPPPHHSGNDEDTVASPAHELRAAASLTELEASAVWLSAADPDDISDHQDSRTSPSARGSSATSAAVDDVSVESGVSVLIRDAHTTPTGQSHSQLSTDDPHGSACVAVDAPIASVTTVFYSHPVALRSANEASDVVLLANAEPTRTVSHLAPSLSRVASSREGPHLDQVRTRAYTASGQEMHPSLSSSSSFAALPVAAPRNESMTSLLDALSFPEWLTRTSSSHSSADDFASQNAPPLQPLDYEVGREVPATGSASVSATSYPLLHMHHFNGSEMSTSNGDATSANNSGATPPPSWRVGVVPSEDVPVSTQPKEQVRAHTHQLHRCLLTLEQRVRLVRAALTWLQRAVTSPEFRVELMMRRDWAFIFSRLSKLLGLAMNELVHHGACEAHASHRADPWCPARAETTAPLGQPLNVLLSRYTASGAALAASTLDVYRRFDAVTMELFLLSLDVLWHVTSLSAQVATQSSSTSDEDDMDDDATQEGSAARSSERSESLREAPPSRTTEEAPDSAASDPEAAAVPLILAVTTTYYPSGDGDASDGVGGVARGERASDERTQTRLVQQRQHTATGQRVVTTVHREVHSTRPHELISPRSHPVAVPRGSRRSPPLSGTAAAGGPSSSSSVRIRRQRREAALQAMYRTPSVSSDVNTVRTSRPALPQFLGAASGARHPTARGRREEQRHTARMVQAFLLSALRREMDVRQVEYVRQWWGDHVEGEACSMTGDRYFRRGAWCAASSGTRIAVGYQLDDLIRDLKQDDTETPMV